MSKSFNSFLQFECYIPHSKIFIITSVIHRMMFRVFKSFNEIKSFRGVTMCMNRLKILQDISCCNNSHYIFLTHPHQPHAYDNILYPSCTKHISNFTNIQEKLQYVWRFINSRAVLSLQNLYKWVCVTNFSETLLSF